MFGLDLENVGIEKGVKSLGFGLLDSLLEGLAEEVALLVGDSQRRDPDDHANFVVGLLGCGRVVGR